MAAALRRAADRLDSKATGTDLDRGLKRRRLNPEMETRLDGRIDGLRAAANDLRHWATACDHD
jgi:hypothetical protein